MFLHSIAPLAQGLIQPNTNWVKKGAFEPAVLPVQPLMCTPAHTPLPNPRGPGDRGGDRLPLMGWCIFKARASCCKRAEPCSSSTPSLPCCVLSIFNAGRFL